MKTKNRHGLYLFIAVVAVALFAIFRDAPVDTLVLASPGTVHAGSTIDLPIVLRTNSTNYSALEWRIATSPEMKVKAVSSLYEKTVQCYKQHCMLYGGENIISPGVVTMLEVRLPDTPSTDVSIRLENVLGATNDTRFGKIREAKLELKIVP